MCFAARTVDCAGVVYAAYSFCMSEEGTFFQKTNTTKNCAKTEDKFKRRLYFSLSKSSHIQIFARHQSFNGYRRTLNSMQPWSCADIFDLKGDAVQCSSIFPFRHFSKLKRFHGAVETVNCFEDNSRVKEMAYSPGLGRVLIVDGKGSQRCALVGDQVAAAALSNGWAGIVVNGAIRDAAAISEMDAIGICALGTNPRKSEKRNSGTIGDRVNYVGIDFVPGDYVYVDEDGIISSSTLIELAEAS